MTSTTALTQFIFFVTLFGLTSCAVDNDPAGLEQPQTETAKSYDDVDEALWIYFERFEEEAALRNITLDLNALGITGVISNIPEEGVAGTCQYGQHIHHVTVDQNYWRNVNDNNREMVVFHELGHCVLGRGHREDANTNGVCLSIMNSGLANCRVAYSGTNQKLYIDELFLFED